MASKYIPYMVVICWSLWYTVGKKGGRTDGYGYSSRIGAATRNGEGDTVLMDLDAFTRREEELDRREAVLDHRAMVLEAELGRLSGEPTYTSDQVRDAVQQHLLNRRRERHG